MTDAIRRLLARFRVSPRTLVVLFGLSLIPLLYAGGLVWSNEDPTHSLDRIPAAIVNEDQPAAVAVGDPIDLGSALTDELLSNDASNNFAWQELDADTAQQRLESGEVLAVLTIPNGFSASAARLGDDDPAQAEQARLRIVTNDGANVIVGNMAASVGTAVADALSAQVSESYLQQVYAGFSTLHGKLGEAADGAGQLADGAGQAQEGAGELVVGLGSLRTGAGQAADGAGQLSDGAGELADGAGQLDTGASDAAAGAGQLADGAQQANAGATQLSDGLAVVDEAASHLPAVASGLAQASAIASDDVSQTAVDAGTAATDASDLAVQTSEVAAGLHALSGSTTAGPAPTTPEATVDTSGVTAAADTVAADAGALSGELAALAAEAPSLTPEEVQARLEGLQGSADTVVSDAADVQTEAASLEPVVTGTTGVAAPVEGDLAGLQAQADAAAASAADLAAQTATVRDGSTRAAAGALVVQGGADALNLAAEPIATSVHGAATGAAALADGTQQLADGSSTLQSGLGQLSDGAGRLSSGADQLSAGADELADGTQQLADGAGEAQDGAQQLEDGTGQLADGGQELQDGLQEGQSEVPDYTDNESQHLSTVAADPVGIDAERQNEVPSYGAGLAPYFLSLGLWVGAMAWFLMMPAIDESLVASRRLGWVVVLRSWLPGAMMAAVQAALMIATVHVLIGVPTVNLWGMLGVAVATGATFMAVNQAFNVLLGAPGRFLALVMVVLQLSSAGATYPIQTTPDFFQTIHGWLPLTYTVEAFRSLIAGGDIGLTEVWPVLLTWFLGSIAAMWLAVELKRAKLRRTLRVGPTGEHDGDGDDATGRAADDAGAGSRAPAGAGARPAGGLQRTARSAGGGSDA